MATPLPLLPSHRLEPNPGPGEATSTNRQRQAHGVGEATRQEKTGFLDDFLGGPGFFLESFINFYLNFLILWLKQHSLYTLLSCPKWAQYPGPRMELLQPEPQPPGHWLQRNLDRSFGASLRGHETSFQDFRRKKAWVSGAQGGNRWGVRGSELLRESIREQRGTPFRDIVDQVQVDAEGVSPRS